MMRSYGDEPDVAWLIAEPLTLARLAAFGATAIFSDARATRRALPEGSSAPALSTLRWRARDAGRMFRLLIDYPGHPAAPAAARHVAKLFAEWPALAGAVHPEFLPLMRATRLPVAFDPIGVPPELGEAVRNEVAMETRNG